MKISREEWTRVRPFARLGVDEVRRLGRLVDETGDDEDIPGPPAPRATGGRWVRSGPLRGSMVRLIQLGWMEVTGGGRGERRILPWMIGDMNAGDPVGVGLFAERNVAGMFAESRGWRVEDEN
jgi:hypothetical protein